MKAASLYKLLAQSSGVAAGALISMVENFWFFFLKLRDWWSTSMISSIIKASNDLKSEMMVSAARLICRFMAAICLALALLLPTPALAAENSFIDAIQQRGYLKVGIPPYNTPPAYYLDADTNELKGYDIDLAKGLADKLGVDIRFDRSSTSFNNLVSRVGSDDFDLAIGRLGLTYKRLYDSFPVQYMSFRHALLADRKFVTSLGVDPGSPEFGKALKQSDIRIGSIANSIWVGESAIHFPNAQFVGFENWDEAKNALLSNNSASGKSSVDAIYRDATEIKKIVYSDPNLSLKYVPILFDDIKFDSSIYLSQKGHVGFSDFLKVFIRREWGDIKTDQVIMDEYQSFYQPAS